MDIQRIAHADIGYVSEATPRFGRKPSDHSIRTVLRNEYARRLLISMPRCAQLAVSGKILRRSTGVCYEDFDIAMRLLRTCPDLEVLFGERGGGDSTYYWKPARPAVLLAVEDAARWKT